MNNQKEKLRKLLQAFEFRKLFINELGWDRANVSLNVQVDGQEFCLQQIAEKRGFAVFVCQIAAAQPFPEYAVRRKIDANVRRSFHEHLIIYTDHNQTQQKWQWVRREPGKPSAGRELSYSAGQSGELIVQRLQSLIFSLEEEEGLTITDVTSRVRASFDVERVTKRFYERFKTEQTAFRRFLQGIPDEDLQRWYVAVMLNRLMFVYFIQRKGFLDGDRHYLRSRLERTRQQLGEDRFYRDFLCPLFFDGFAKKEHSQQTRALLGNVPYLNGGIFQRHQLEERFGQAIQIPDAAFTRLFDFFDSYNWHLDERPLRADNEINPDVLGFIFEKYINQKQMGAYYTKEDITGYISKYTILPALFDRVRKDCKIAFEGEGAVWKYLAAEPDRYIYPAMLKGLDLPLPEAVAAGVDDVAQRGEWNRPADEAYALPTEIWRETVARRQRAEAVRARLAAGEVHEINDLITDNLDIQQFAQDVIEWSEGPELVRAFWKALTEIRVLDPTCGSGAFLFAALNILEPLYEACLDRMQTFIDELEAAKAQGKKHHPEKFSDFRRILEQIERHPNRRYFILKNIIVQNLYGVDIMEEAVEICQLRLFLKLIAQVEQVEDIEPLPDIDFNVRAGNTLVGFTNREEVRKALTSQGQQGTLGLFGESEAVARVEKQAELADKAFRRFRQMQTELDMDTAAFASGKAELRKRLNDLHDELNRALALRYLSVPIKEDAYQKWLKTHHPFHWFVDFYGIMNAGGFDVIIGNPPYIEYNKVKNDYVVQDYETITCGNLYSFVLERAFTISKTTTRLGVIVPISSFATERMKKLQTLVMKGSSNVWLSSYGIRPSKLFEGAEQRLTICLTEVDKNNKGINKIFTTKYYRWYTSERPYLFPQLAYQDITCFYSKYGFPKISSILEANILAKFPDGLLGKYFDERSDNIIYWHRIPAYFIKALDFVPYFKSDRDGIKKSEDYKVFGVNKFTSKGVILSLLNSSIFYWFWFAISEGYHCGKHEVLTFPVEFEKVNEEILISLENRSQELMQDLIRNSKIRQRIQKTTSVEYQEFYPSLSKPIMDRIDYLLSHIYSLTEDELDFVINYDIKYRMGQELREDEDL